MAVLEVRCDRHVGEAHPPRCSACDAEQAQHDRSRRCLAHQVAPAVGGCGGCDMFKSELDELEARLVCVVTAAFEPLAPVADAQSDWPS